MEHQPLSLLRDIGLSIVFAAAAGHAARWLRQPLILGYVLGGVLLGAPIGFGLVAEAGNIELISEIGLILLLFIIGLEIDLRELLRMGRDMFILGVSQFLVSAALAMALFWPLGYRLGGGRFDLLYVGVALALSSTLIVVKLLHDKFETHTVAGRLTIGVLILQDVWAILFMAFQPNFADPALGGFLRAFGLGGLLVAGAFLASRYLLARVFDAVGRCPELILMTAIAWCFLTAGLAERAGLSKEMGALIAGLSLAAFPHGMDVIAKISGIRDFFVTLFFVSLGLKLPRPDAALAATAAYAVGVVLLTRLLSVVPAAHLLGRGLRNGCVSALNLSQISEFSLVILALGVGYGHVRPELQSAVLTSMLLASVVSTYLISANDQLARGAVRLLAVLGLREAAVEARTQAELGPPRDIVVLGCFREGAALLEGVERRAPELAQRMLIVDFNPGLRKVIERKGARWVYGDLAHPDTLRHIGIEAAGTVVCPISDLFLKGTTNRRLLGQLRKLAPKARLIMTASDGADALRLRQAGADEVLVPGQLVAERALSLLRESPPTVSTAGSEAV